MKSAQRPMLDARYGVGLGNNMWGACEMQEKTNKWITQPPPRVVRELVRVDVRLDDIVDQCQDGH